MLGRILQRREKTNGMYEDEEILKDMVMTTYLGTHHICEFPSIYLLSLSWGWNGK